MLQKLRAEKSNSRDDITRLEYENMILRDELDYLRDLTESYEGIIKEGMENYLAENLERDLIDTEVERRLGEILDSQLLESEFREEIGSLERKIDSLNQIIKEKNKKIRRISRLGRIPQARG